MQLTDLNADVFPSSLITTLPDHGVIRVTGDETIKYLQGQVTIDMSEVSLEQGALGCHCDFKGKCWNIFYATGDAQAISLISHRESISASIAELKKYGVFAKVDIEDQSDQWQLYAGYGDAFETILSGLIDTLPQAHLETSVSDGLTVICLTAPVKRYIVAVRDDIADPFSDAMATTGQQENIWEALDILAGYPNIQQATSNEFVPQMLNIQALDGINFKKGCYMGQEVVARTKYLGKNKRAAFILKSEQASKLEAGDTLEMQIGENWRRGGTVVRCAMLEKETWVLAVLANDTESDAVFRNKNLPEQTFTVQPLPYSIEA